jgi:hypothetical protein
MSDVVHVGQVVPDFEMDVFNPKSHAFEKVSLADLKKTRNGRSSCSIRRTTPSFAPPSWPTWREIRRRRESGRGSDFRFHRHEIRSLGVAEGRETFGKRQISHGLRSHRKNLPPVRRLRRSDGLALRGTFIISPEGRLASSEVNFYNVGRNAAELLRKAQANAYLAVHPQEACPANWNQGGKTLKTANNEATWWAAWRKR